jgi:hypothetical protein
MKTKKKIHKNLKKNPKKKSKKVLKKWDPLLDALIPEHFEFLQWEQ